MEQLSLEDRPPLGPSGQYAQPHPPMAPPPAPALPAQMFTTAAQLLDLTDSEHLLPHDASSYHEAGAQIIPWLTVRAAVRLSFRETHDLAEGWTEIDWCAEELGSVRYGTKPCC